MKNVISVLVGFDDAFKTEIHFAQTAISSTEFFEIIIIMSCH